MMFELPWPPSINHYWRHTAKGKFVITYISGEGKKYRKNVLKMLATHNNTLAGRLRVSVAAYPPDRRKRDLDNVFKCLLDSLEHAKVYEDDNQIDYLSIERKEVRKGGLVLVNIEEVE